MKAKNLHTLSLDAADREHIVITLNFNRLEFDAWIEHQRLPDGNYKLVGMGRKTEYDANTGAVVSNKVSPTGVTGWAPAEAIDGPKRTWWDRIVGR